MVSEPPGFGPLCTALWLACGMVYLKQGIQKEIARLPNVLDTSLRALVKAALGFIQAYLDDRIGVVPTLCDAKLHIETWATWSSLCGLRENSEKLQVMTKRMAMEPEAVRPWPRVCT